jgi:hypothetical protein
VKSNEHRSVSPNDFIDRLNSYAVKSYEKKQLMQAKLDAEYSFHPETVSEAQGSFKER